MGQSTSRSEETDDGLPLKETSEVSSERPSIQQRRSWLSSGEPSKPDSETKKESKKTKKKSRSKKSKKKVDQADTLSETVEYQSSKRPSQNVSDLESVINDLEDKDHGSKEQKPKPQKQDAKSRQPTTKPPDDASDEDVDFPITIGKGHPQLQLPTNKAAFSTFIDDDSQVDDQGYPTYPNGNTIFVLHPEEKVTNFGFVAWTHTMRTDSKHPLWRVRRFYCLGVIGCTDPNCRLAGSPPTGYKAIPALLGKFPNCPVSDCDGLRIHVPCDARCRFDEEKSTHWQLLRHQGRHNHVWPEAKKADRISKAKLKEMVINDPKTGPLGLKVGRANASKNPIQSVANIHSSFGHIDRLGYLRRDILVKNELMPDNQDPDGADRWLTKLEHWGKQGMRLVSSSLKIEEIHISFQGAWMEEVLLYESKSGESYSGGLLSDVTYCFFLNGYLLTTSMYNGKLERWVPVLLTFLKGLSTHHYKAHFKTLFTIIDQTSKSENQTRRLLEQVVDFSLAQRNGFIEAYMEVFRGSDKVEALSKLHGCKQHFMAAVTRIKKNSSIVPVDQDVRWNLYQLFPRAKKWLDWWKASDIQAMLFPSRKRLPLDDPPLPGEEDDDNVEEDQGPRRRPELPGTTNAQESMHRVYYLLCPGKCAIIPGFVQLFALVQSLEHDYRQVQQGCTVTYGVSKKNWETVVTNMGMAKPTKRKYKSEGNDGRAPDTTKELLGITKSKKRSEVKKKGPGRPKGSQNVPRKHPGTAVGRARRWSACMLFLAHYGAGMPRSTALPSASFPAGEFASANGFMDELLRPGKISLRPLFEIPFRKVTTCFREAKHSTTSISSRLGQLIDLWQSQGLTAGSDMVCRKCHPSERTSRGNVVNVDVDDEPAEEDDQGRCNSPEPEESEEKKSMLEQTLKIHLTDRKSAPLHLYFHLDGVGAMTHEMRESYMGDTDWPARIMIGGVEYMMVTRGFWANSHYWCKVVRSVEGIMGVWHYNELRNAGRAQLLDRNVATIAGCEPHTSWTIPFTMPSDNYPFGGSLPLKEKTQLDGTTAEETTATTDKTLTHVEEVQEILEDIPIECEDEVDELAFDAEVPTEEEPSGLLEKASHKKYKGYEYVIVTEAEEPTPESPPAADTGGLRKSQRKSRRQN
ncbi:uncharacterized protein MELLADRAFT_93987 [Melampsora larici-populina 98AG31]|uniref:Uncharacterized protein n=1 Tax=Melampsora larici-populina (strain 98AG31 / pathotype 3-4-7) TaxID=747676 RepID=F4S601_MELLP|nr:uncharacterized protein MELLADRAFT_93987 [Melampsora larici-populina 98AG31]EGF99848.1 hypothetical protein MELLADRAFT_93987 [Melampsora larici-populina 98AG31]